MAEITYPMNVGPAEEFYLNVDGDIVKGTPNASDNSNDFSEIFDFGFDIGGKDGGGSGGDFSEIFDFGFDIGGKGGGGDTDGKGGGGFGATLSGIGSVVGALASIYGIREQKKYQDKVLGMEKERVAKNEARRDAKQAEYEKVWG